MFGIGIFALVFITLFVMQVLGLESYGSFAAGAVAAFSAAVLSVLIRKPRKPPIV
jgi:hypothetical protein